MKTALSLSTLAVLSVISTASFAQNAPTSFGPASFGNSSAIITIPASPATTFAASDRGASDRGAQDRGYAPPQHRYHHARATSAH